MTVALALQLLSALGPAILHAFQTGSDTISAEHQKIIDDLFLQAGIQNDRWVAGRRPDQEGRQ